MSILKTKSETNRMAADTLMKNNLYCSVVHCAYYSCFQMMSHLAVTQMGKTEQELRKEEVEGKKGSHEVLIGVTLQWLRSKKRNIRDFNNDIGILKKLRVEADYQNVEITVTKSSTAIQLCDSLITILKRA